MSAPKKRRSLWMLSLLLLSTCFGIDWADGSAALAQSERSRTEWPEAQSRGMREVLDALRARERALDRREQSLESREADLRSVERDLEARLDELSAARTESLVEIETARAELESLTSDADNERLERITGLVRMVESMRPSNAADVLTALDENLAADVLNQMNTSKAGKILAKMDPLKAATLAEMLTD